MNTEHLPVGSRVVVTVKSHDGSGYYPNKERTGTVTRITPSGYKVRIDGKNLIVNAKKENVRLAGE